jgi:hypothetical protein
MSEQPEKCRECGGTGETEDDATGALGYVVKRACTACPRRQPTFEKHVQRMVEPDFNPDSMHPNDEPFWLIASPYGEPSDNPFLLDRGGVYELIEQLQKALGDYYAKHPLSPEDADVSQMRPGRPKARPPLRREHDAVQD